MDATEVRDPYEVLKLPNGADSTEQEIKKASSLQRLCLLHWLQANPLLGLCYQKPGVNLFVT